MAVSSQPTGTGSRISSFARSVPEFFRQVEAERKKVAWPSRRETVMTAVMVAIMTTLLALFFLAVDSGFDAIVKSLLTLAQ